MVASFLGLVALSPLLLTVACLIRRQDRGPVFYRGLRIGRNGEPFRIIKFRTMVLDADKLGPSSSGDDDLRITRVGKVLRKYKLDELPQLINVLRGEMSFVGPRPQVKWAVDLYSEEERRILSVRPGITSRASLKFADEGRILKGSRDPDGDYLRLIHPEKMKLDQRYLQERGFWVDISIIMQTVWQVLS